MDCERVAELLPWFLNGTLEAAEQQQVREHLAQCQKCQQELHETMLAWGVYQQHVPTEALIDDAFDRPVLTLPQDLIERHLKTCQECAEQIELVRESRQGAESRKQKAEGRKRKAEETRQWRAFQWHYVALAASLVGVIALGGWLWNWQQSRALQVRLREEQRAVRERLANLEAENQRLRQAEAQLREQQDQAKQEVAQLEKQIKEMASPQLNTPVLDVYPSDLTHRAERPSNNELPIPPGVKVITLILNAENPTAYRNYSIEMVDAQNTVVWSAQGLVRNATGDYTISLPTEFLPPGSFTLNIYGEAKGKRVKVENYRIRIAHLRR